MSAARRFAATTLKGMPSDIVDSVTLMVSELATNAVSHATSAFEVEIDRQPGQVLVNVFDNDSHSATRMAHATLDPSGRGLQIVGSLSDDWGVRRPVPGWKKAVWFSMRLPPLAD